MNDDDDKLTLKYVTSRESRLVVNPCNSCFGHQSITNTEHDLVDATRSDTYHYVDKDHKR